MRLIGENANVLMDRTPDAGSRGRRAGDRRRSARDIELNRLRLRESAGRYFADVVVERARPARPWSRATARPT